MTGGTKILRCGPLIELSQKLKPENKSAIAETAAVVRPPELPAWLALSIATWAGRSTATGRSGGGDGGRWELSGGMDMGVSFPWLDFSPL